MEVFRTKETQLKDYNGYEIWKIEDYNHSNKKINTVYMVEDEDDVINVFKTLNDAKQYIDRVLVD